MAWTKFRPRPEKNKVSALKNRVFCTHAANLKNKLDDNLVI